MRERKERENEENKEIKEDPRSSLTFRRSELIGPISKVFLRDESYAPRGRDSSYFDLFPP